MAYLNFGDLKATGLAQRLNLCANDVRFRDAVNRATRWLMLHGHWHGTQRIVQLPINDYCIVTPGAVASLDGVYTPCGPVQLQGIGYQFLPHWRPMSDCGAPLAFIAHDTVPTFYRIVVPGLIRTYLTNQADIGKTVTYLGYTSAGQWIRTLQSGVWRDGERITLATPYVDTVNTFASVASILKDETEGQVRSYYLTSATVPMRDLTVMEYWETRPHLRRYKVPRYREVSGCGCTCSVVECLVKLEFIPVKNDADMLLIGNVPALEIAMEALNYKDSGDLARADALLFGTRKNKRLGAVPLLQQELRTYSGDNSFTGHVSVHGTPGMRRVMAGFN